MDDEMRTLLHQYVTCLNERNIDELAGLVADRIEHNGTVMTRQQWWDGPVGQHLQAVPDQMWTVEDVVVSGDRMAVRYRDGGTPVAPWIGLAPTGTRIDFREYVFYTVRDGRIAEVWSVFDSETVRRQLMPQPDAAAGPGKGGGVM